jgi:hypothetical protein
MIVLVRFGMSDDGEIDTGLAHAPQQVFGRGGLVGLIRSIRMIGIPGIVATGEAMHIGIDHRTGQVIGRVRE